MNKKIFTADIQQLPLMLAFVEMSCLRIGFDFLILNKIIISIEEALVNIIYHSGLSIQDAIHIECKTASEKCGIKIHIQDAGIAFDPTQFKKKPLGSVGGKGILLYTHLMDTIEYKRKGTLNHLTLTKFLI